MQCIESLDMGELAARFMVIDTQRRSLAPEKCNRTE
jgi:hypothetical protein